MDQPTPAEVLIHYQEDRTEQCNCPLCTYRLSLAQSFVAKGPGFKFQAIMECWTFDKIIEEMDHANR